MKVGAQVAAYLATLTATFDGSDIDIVDTLTRLIDLLRSAVPSYLGLSVTMATAESTTEIATPDDVGSNEEIGSSLSIPTADVLGDSAARGRIITLVVYAAAAGALVDLAADMAWLLSRPLTEFALDRHLAGPSTLRSDAVTESIVNQAVGVLIGRGETPQQAIETIDAMAAGDCVDRRTAAAALLDGLAHPKPDDDL